MFEWSHESEGSIWDNIAKIINFLFDHPSIRNIKQKSKTKNKFSLKPVNEDLVRGIVKELSMNKVESGDIVVKLLKGC